jgi:bifunctional non-homologous end joining protein LigD
MHATATAKEVQEAPGTRAAAQWRAARQTRLPALTGLTGATLARPRTLPAGFVQPCLPTKAPRPPCGELWLHEIKHDGFRVIARKDGPRVKLYNRPGNDLTPRFPLIVEA